MTCLNIASLPKHIDELRVLLDNQWCDIIAINETRLDEIIDDDEVKINGYNIIRIDRQINGRNGGGVCIYVRTNINYTRRNYLESQSLEYLSLEIKKPRSKPFVVTTFYRPPNAQIELFTHLEALIGKIFENIFDRRIAMSKIHRFLDRYAKTWLFCLVGKFNSFLGPRPPGTTEISENSHVQWQVSQKLFH